MQTTNREKIFATYTQKKIIIQNVFFKFLKTLKKKSY